MNQSWWVVPVFDFLHFDNLQFVSYMFHELMADHSLHWSADSRSLEYILANVEVKVKLITKERVHKLFNDVAKLLVVR